MNARRLLLPALGLLCAAAAAGADWPAFRGPHANGVSDDVGLPVTWGPEQNVVWKVKLPGPGASSPIILGERVFVTCYTDYGIGKKGGDVKELRRHLLCLDRKTGKPLWQRDVATRLPETNYNNYLAEHGY